MTTVMGTAMIEAVDLRKVYRDIVALQGVSFSVRPGEVFGILGPNGAGKTTLVEILEGLTRPTAGSARVLGYDIATEPQQVKQRIGVQLQASSYHEYLTLREILELFASFYPDADDPLELLRRVRLEDRVNSRIKHLSGGMKQRFSIVAALVNRPALVFFDEPTAGLDPDARRDLWSIVRQVRDAGATVVLTTHYMEEAEELCDRVMLMNAGQIAALDTPAGLVRSMGAPYRVRLTTDAPLPDEGIAVLDDATDIVRLADGTSHVLELRAPDAPRAVGVLIAAMQERGIAVIDLAVQPATLEDVFLATTGRELGGT